MHNRRKFFTVSFEHPSRNHVGASSFSCFKAALTRPIEDVKGSLPLKDYSTSSRLGIIVSGRFDQDLVNTF